jgi:hypothetical protein
MDLSALDALQVEKSPNPYDKLQPLITEIETIIGHAYGKQEDDIVSECDF